jgi:hypothetical protein
MGRRVKVLSTTDEVKSEVGPRADGRANEQRDGLNSLIAFRERVNLIWERGALMLSRLAVAAFVFSLSACASSGDSTVHPPAADTTTSASFAGTPFYVDFRTRPSAVDTHTFLEYGAQDSSGHPLEQKTVGFFPRGAGVLGPLIGIVAMPGEVGPEDYFAKLPSAATFHRNLTAEQYNRLTAYIQSEQAKPQIFNLLFNNCNDFVAGAAQAIGLKAPDARMSPPTVFINQLAQLNS